MDAVVRCARVDGPGSAGHTEMSMVGVQDREIVQASDKGPHLVNTAVDADILALD